MRNATKTPEPLWTDLGSAFAYQAEESGRWVAVVDVGGDQLDLPGSYDTQGGAVDALNAWAKQRNLMLTWQFAKIRKVHPKAVVGDEDDRD